MHCIYCRRLSDEAKSLAHIFPEGLKSDDLTLPRGTVCDGCNHYLGANLDSALVEHPLIAFPIQFLGLRGGKKARLRSDLGGIRGDKPRQAITIPVTLTDEEVSWGADGRISVAEVSVRQLAKHGADEWKFSRALHHVAMNVVAYARGWSFMLHPDFDPVRKYVREPSPMALWPYAIRSEGLSAIPDRLEGTSVAGAPDGILKLTFFQVECFVDLRNAASFEPWVQTNLPEDTLYRVPRRSRLSSPRSSYELTIYLDGDDHTGEQTTL